MGRLYGRIFGCDYVKSYCQNNNLILLNYYFKNHKERIDIQDNQLYKYSIFFNSLIVTLKHGYILDKFGLINNFAIENMILFQKRKNRYFFYEIPTFRKSRNDNITVCDLDEYLYWTTFELLQRTLEGDFIFEKFRKTNIYSLKNIELYLKLNDIPFCLVENQKYKNSTDNLNYICNNGHNFSLSWGKIMSGRGCTICGKINRPISFSKFCIARNNIMDSNPDILLEWSELNIKGPEEYTCGTKKLVYWKCLAGKNHPDYAMQPYVKIGMGCGCPICNTSHGEKDAILIFKKFGINYIYQFGLDECKYINKLKFDFYFPDYNVLVEINGQQHYYPVSIFGGEKSFISQQKKDQIKREYCFKNNIKLIEIPYWKFDSMESIFKMELNL